MPSNSGMAFDREAADRWEPCLKYYLRGWLPVSLGAGIVDLGCGDGKVLYLLKKLGYRRLAGVDLSSSKSAVARQVIDAVETIDVVTYLRHSGESLDLVLALDLIEHLPRSETSEFLDLCVRRLRPNGRIVLRTPNGISPFFGQVRYDDPTHEQCFTPASLASLLADAGFSCVEVRESHPVPRGYSVRSSLRYVCWRLVRLVFAAINLVETGGVGRGVWSRVFYVSAVKPTPDSGL